MLITSKEAAEILGMKDSAFRSLVYTDNKRVGAKRGELFKSLTKHYLDKKVSVSNINFQNKRRLTRYDYDEVLALKEKLKNGI